MKTVISSALIAAALVVTGPAGAQQITDGAMAAANHFNQDVDGQGDRIVLQVGLFGLTSTEWSEARSGAAQERFNQDFDGQDDVRSSRSARDRDFNQPVNQRAAQIFADIRRQNAEDE